MSATPKKIQLSIKLTEDDVEKFIQIKEYYGLQGDADTFRLCLSDSYRVLEAHRAKVAMDRAIESTQNNQAMIMVRQGVSMLLNRGFVILPEALIELTNSGPFNLIEIAKLIVDKSKPRELTAKDIQDAFMELM